MLNRFKSEGLKKAAPGFGLSAMVALIAYLTSTLHPSFDQLVISIIFGMLVSNMLVDRDMIEKGIDSALRVFLPIGIGTYGIQLKVAGASLHYLPAVLAGFAVMFLVTYFISRGFGLSKSLSVLLGTGMSICGASAIIVIAPIINAKKEDTSISIISIMTIGLTGMLFYRFLPDLMGLTQERFAFFTGMTLPMLGQVKVAASSMGSDAVAAALNYKLIRVSSLALAALAALYYTSRKGSRVHLPWFMVVFFVLAALSNMFGPVADLRRFLEPVSKFALSAALSAIGLSLDFDSITERGIAPLFSSFLSWSIIVLALYLVFAMVS